MTEQPAAKKVFSSRLMGMKFMQRAAERKAQGKRKADDLHATAADNCISLEAPGDAVTSMTREDEDQGASSECVVIKARGSSGASCRIVMDYSGADEVVYGRRSFSSFNPELEKAQGQGGTDGQVALDAEVTAPAPADREPSQTQQQQPTAATAQEPRVRQRPGFGSAGGATGGARTALSHLLKRRKKRQEDGMTARGVA